ncbi:MAG: DMT family transporter [Lachnospiraceae bacterium]
MKKQIRGSLLLLLTATIWGIAFVAQSAGMDYIGAFTFNCVRSLIGGVVLIPCIFLIRALNNKQDMGKPEKNRETCENIALTQNDNSPELKQKRKTLLMGGISCGVILCMGSNLQQLALKTATVGKAGFITALYIVMVPVAGLFFHKKVGTKAAMGVVLAVMGLYCLCVDGDFGSWKTEDILLLGTALVFTAHILVVDYFAPMTDCVAMSCIQFFVCGIISGVFMFLLENPSLSGIIDAAVPVLYAGVCSSGIAYTLQIVGQRDVNPTMSSMIMSLESVISVLAGYFLLNEVLTKREMAGCILMFAAIILSQLPDRKK